MESIWLDKKCSSCNCQKPIKYFCSCPGNPVFCGKHSTPHYMNIKCDMKDIDNEKKKLLIKSIEKALDILTLKMIEKTEDLIKEINKVVKSNIDFIEDIKSKIQSQDPSLNLEETSTWAKNFNFKVDNMNAFPSYSRYLLSVKRDSEEIESKLKEEQDLIKDGKFFAELKKVSETNPSLKQIIKEINESWNRREFIGKLESEQFRSLSQDQQKESLAKQEYQDFRVWFVERGYLINKISLTNDNKFIFICKE